ncbi:MAG: phosphoenolpyruvate--protein phosphotransferase [Rhodospirillales bacterium 20-60-12]|nr:MAG: phosphoenolpyruvate--protein phosphotransferase [Rhodospirillales bacterium 20-60-12]HQT66174.1 phosphoenolpyruvate--protein phosphotransferase [Acetobacteraceae bacterium]
MSSVMSSAVIAAEMISLDAQPASKEQAIAWACQLLVAAGCVEPGYEASMSQREAVANTYLGHDLAIPHGLGEDRAMVRRDGIAVLQIPAGLEWNPGQTARLVVAIAAKSDTHINILRRLTRLIQDTERLDRLFVTSDKQDLIAALTQDGTMSAPRAPAADLDTAINWTVTYPAGLHARPATAWVEAARKTALRLQIRHGAEVADPRNLVGLLQLGLRQGDQLVISAEGNDAPAVLARFRAVIDGLTAGEQRDAAKAAAAQDLPVGLWAPQGQTAFLAGIGASPGLAIGPVHVVAHEATEVLDRPAPLADGGSALHEAIVTTRLQMRALVDSTTRRLGAADAAIFKAQSELLNDSDLITLTCQLMVEGHGVAWAWNQAVERMAGKLSALGNPVLAGRAADLRDVGRRVLTQLDTTQSAGSLQSLPAHPCIILAHDLSPSDTASLEPGSVLGLAIAQGGPTAHSAILARTLGLPAIVAAGTGLLGVETGTLAIIDGRSGRLYLNPSADDIASAQSWIAARDAERATQAQQRSLPATTRDGQAIAIGANVNRPDQVAYALDEGAEAVGLMRTEFLFLEAGATPSEAEQHDVYRGMIQALSGPRGDRPLIIRALDIGGDKQVAHLDLPHEDNPFLGVRGARLLLRRPDLLEPQLRAIYRAAIPGGDVSIMFPMVTSLDEVLQLRAICERIRAAVAGPELPIGIMIEVPAAAIMADLFAEHVDFFSIGTNDLTQYTLAIDRQNPDLAAEADSLHPAVLRLIQQTVQGAGAHKRWVGVCGGIAGDPFGAALLAGLGVAELSMTPRDIPAVKARLRASDSTTLQDIARRALACHSPAQVRALESLLA